MSIASHSHCLSFVTCFQDGTPSTCVLVSDSGYEPVHVLPTSGAWRAGTNDNEESSGEEISWSFILLALRRRASFKEFVETRRNCQQSKTCCKGCGSKSLSEPFQAFGRSRPDPCAQKMDNCTLNLWACLSFLVRSVYEVTPPLVWAWLVDLASLDASFWGRTTQCREVAHTSAPWKATFLTFGDARGSGLLSGGRTIGRSIG